MGSLYIIDIICFLIYTKIWTKSIKCCYLGGTGTAAYVPLLMLSKNGQDPLESIIYLCIIDKAPLPRCSGAWKYTTKGDSTTEEEFLANVY